MGPVPQFPGMCGNRGLGLARRGVQGRGGTARGVDRPSQDSPATDHDFICGARGTQPLGLWGVPCPGHSHPFPLHRPARPEQGRPKPTHGLGCWVPPGKPCLSAHVPRGQPDPAHVPRGPPSSPPAQTQQLPLPKAPGPLLSPVGQALEPAFLTLPHHGAEEPSAPWSTAHLACSLLSPTLLTPKTQPRHKRPRWPVGGGGFLLLGPSPPQEPWQARAGLYRLCHQQISPWVPELPRPALHKQAGAGPHGEGAQPGAPG